MNSSIVTTDYIEKLEWSLILGNSIQEKSQNSTEILVSEINNGQYKKSLTCEISKQILGTDLSSEDDSVKNFLENLDIKVYISNRIKKYISTDSSESESNHSFRQINLL